MEPKTIGKFITTLRKANGMTQRELAELLNVSDKTISRWERDDGAPDLATIPVIAEFFGVTCDELLRGERRSPSQRTGEAAESTARGEKQRRRLLDMTWMRYRHQSWITIGISVVGLIAAVIGNLGFQRSFVGFFSGAIFFVAAAVMLAICVNRAFHAISDDIIPEAEAVKCRSAICMVTKRTLCIMVILFAAMLPLILFPKYSHLGLAARSWLQLGLCFGAAAFVLCRIVWHMMVPWLLRREYMTLEEGKEESFWKNRKTIHRCALCLAVVMAVTCAVQLGVNEVYSPYRIAEGKVFTDYASFRQYMVQDVAYDPEVSNGDTPTPVPSKQEMIRREIWVYHDDPEGKMVCRYVQRNMSVKTVRTSDTADGLPVTAISYAEYHDAEQKLAVVNGCFHALYAVQFLAVLISYRKKRIQ